ncbi:MAG: DUF2391 family protein [Nanoarchaeota archaeon]|nr:DUF2391 family protein [Nanoarchaeota archaeon]
MKKIDKLAKDIELIKKEILPKEPEHFNVKDIIHAFFGALVVGLTFMFKGLLLESSLRLSWTNIVVIIITTVVIITLEIYFIGYSRVTTKKERKPGQFVIKRFITVYLITLTVSLFLINIFGISSIAGNVSNVFKLVFVLGMPCGIGATLADLFKKY